LQSSILKDNYNASIFCAKWNKHLWKEKAHHLAGLLCTQPNGCSPALPGACIQGKCRGGTW